MKAIVAVDMNWGIGFKGDLLQRIPEDMKFFKQMTVGKVVVMGRNTFESLPTSNPLKDRTNIVLSKNRSFNHDKVIVCESQSQLVQKLDKYSTDDVFVIGGEAIYTMLLPFCNEAYITKIESRYSADKYFENLDKRDTWKLVSSSDVKFYEGIRYRFLKYVNQIRQCKP